MLPLSRARAAAQAVADASRTARAAFLARGPRVRRAFTSFPPPSIDHLAPFQTPPKSLVWLALGVSVAGYGAVATVRTEHKSHAETATSLGRSGGGGGDAGNGDGPQGEATAPAVTKATEEPVVARRLAKRKTSLKDGKYLMSAAAVRGSRTHMEDTSYISGCKRFAAVYDGHGGAKVSQYLRARLFDLVEPVLSRLDKEPEGGGTAPHALEERRKQVEQALRSAVEQVDADVLERGEWKYQGSTAVGVLLFDDLIFSFNVGDSRAILCRSGDAVELTHDHKPNDPEELARVQSLGGTVKWHGYVDAQGDPIEPYGAYRINGNLAVARAVGDRDSRPFVTGEPDVKAIERDYYKDEFIVIASDGLWDVFSNDEVITFVQDVLSGEVGGRESWRSAGHADTRVPIFEWSQLYRSDRSMIKAARKRRKELIANYLVQEALFRGTSDNVSVIVVWLR